MEQIIIDSNIFIRHLIGDIPDQLEKTKLLFSHVEKGDSKAYVSILVINEVLWILEHYYKLKRSLFIPQLIAILTLKHINCIELRKDRVIQILQKMQGNSFDFTDVYLSFIKESKTIVTFDKDFKKL